MYIILEASTDLQDSYNLVDVYLDAGLHAAWYEDETRFMQEGWHDGLGSRDVSGPIKRDRRAEHYFL